MSSVIILYGTAGVGKTTVAKEIEKSAGYHYYEGDDDLLPETQALNAQGKGLTPELRIRQNNLVVDRIVELSKTHQTLVVAYHFMWDRYRRRLIELLPEAKWVLLKIDSALLLKRVDRPGHLLGVDFALRVAELFEPTTFEHLEIDNAREVKVVAEEILDLVG